MRAPKSCSRPPLCRRAYAAQGKPPSVSTLSVATGLRRREVQRLIEEQTTGASPPKVSLAAQVRLRWTTDPMYLDAQGQPRRLPRTAPPGQASFTTLAATISKDVHARPLLDELVRMGAAEEDADQVLLRRDPLNAPDRSWDELVTIGGSNVADHLSAVLVNLLSKPRPLFEQAIFADGLTQQSAQRGADLARQAWQQAAPALRDKLQTLVDLDEQVADNGWRMRIGMYTYIAPADRPAAPVNARRNKQIRHEPGAAAAPADKESKRER
jgi:hypothetical protein